MGINKFLKQVKKDFYIYGELDDNWEEFNKDKEYDGFVVQRKIK